MFGTNDLLQRILNAEGFKNFSFKSIAGGDINEVFLVVSNAETFVIKINDAEKFPGMFEAEKEGLNILRKTGSIKIPEVFKVENIENRSFLMLEYIPQGKKREDFWKIFGKQLASLHRNSAETFGFHQSNYIGSLPQYNNHFSTASEFYINQRLEPQIKMVRDNGFKFSGLSNFFKNISEEIPQEKPSLIHGDLWNGNFLVSENSEPVLIDPAVSFALREMDIGMMHLFGGFNAELFISYNEVFPLEKNWHERLPIWQLYYLLVHLNIFGSGYYNSVADIIKRYC